MKRDYVKDPFRPVYSCSNNENRKYTGYFGYRKKLRGYLFGSACGDALGLPVEHLTLDEIKETGKRGFSISSQILPGQMTLS